MLKIPYIIKTIITVSSALLLILSSVSFAKESGLTDIYSYSCKDVMRMTGGDREISISYLHGYWMGKNGKTKFDKKKVEEMTNQFYDQCLDNPTHKAVETMGKLEK